MISEENRRVILSKLPLILKDGLDLHWPLDWIHSAVSNSFIKTIEDIIIIKQELLLLLERNSEDIQFRQKADETLKIIDSEMLEILKRNKFYNS